MTYKTKYIYKLSRLPESGPDRGRPLDPSTWKSPQDPIERDRYYAYLKHRSQAWYRCEDYELTYEEWVEFWPIDQFILRGQTRDSLCLTRRDWEAAWSKKNCQIITRKENLAMQGKMRKEKNK